MNADNTALQAERELRPTPSIRGILDRLGISSKYKGYLMMAYALEISLADDMAVTEIMHRIYPQVAEHFHTTSVNVEKDLRKAVTMFWVNGNRELYGKLTGFLPGRKPTTAEFIGAVTAGILRMMRRRG